MLSYIISGSRSIILLDYSGPAINVPANEIHYSFDLLNSNFRVPAVDTYYNCKLFKLPEFQSKQHIVKVSFFYVRMLNEVLFV